MQLTSALHGNPLLKALLTAVTTATLIWSYESQFRGIYPLFKSLGSWNNESQALLAKQSQSMISRPTARLRQVKSVTRQDDRYANSSAEDWMLQKYIRLTSDGDGSSSSRLKAVITILGNQPRVNLLKQSLEQLYRHFNRQFGYPVIVFHEANFKPHLAAVRAIGFDRRLNRSSIFFQQVDLSVPSSYLKKFGQPPRGVCGGARSFGYRSMCRFQAKMIYEEPMMRHFDYQWRLDDDSILDSRISFDVFAALRDAGCSYGYFQTIIDTSAHNTFNVTADYMKLRGIRPTFFSRLKWWEVFFNNFEVSSLKIWRSKQYRNFLEYVDSLGGIYTHRWGDAPIKTLALSMFVPLAEIYQFRNVSYRHHGLSSPLTTKFLGK